MTTDVKSIAQRIELHTVHSLTLTDQEFLTGGKGKAVKLSASYRIAQGTGRLPVVMLMHGSGGLTPGVQSWETHLNALGISTFAIDGFTGRGLTSVNTNQALLGRLNFIVDVFRSMEILEKHDLADPSRIVLMGFSRGGQASIYATVERFRKMWRSANADFAAYIPFYPDCGTTYHGDDKVAAKPIRVHHGAADDYNSFANAEAYVSRLKAEGADIELYSYPDAHHSFDNPLNFGKTLVSTGSQAVSGCDIREGDGGVLLNHATGKPFSYTDTCVNTNPHVGGNEAAANAARTSVAEFLKELFRI